MAHKHPVYDTDKHFIIDPVTKKISTECPKVALPQHSKKSERFTFELPRMVEGHDMSLCNVVEVHYQNVDAANKSNRSVGIYVVDYLTVKGETVYGSWLIDEDATYYAGGLMFAVHFMCVINGKIEYDLPTLSYSNITIGETVWNSEVVADEYPAIIEDFEARISNLEQRMSEDMYYTEVLQEERTYSVWRNEEEAMAGRYYGIILDKYLASYLYQHFADVQYFVNGEEFTFMGQPSSDVALISCTYNGDEIVYAVGLLPSLDGDGLGGVQINLHSVSDPEKEKLWLFQVGKIVIPRKEVIHKIPEKYLPDNIGAVKTVNGVAPDENGNVQIEVSFGYDNPTLSGEVYVMAFPRQTLPEFQKAIARNNIGAVATVNGVAPDENGNVQIAVSGGSGVAVSSVEPAEDDIPKVFFGGALQQTKDEKVVPFRYISKTEDISGYAEIKAQGNSSMSYPKKNQTVKLFKDEACTEKLKVDFKGWGKQNKHVYKANWIDLTHARNVVSARLWADVVKSRANYADLPELFRTSPNQGAVDGFPVKVYADGIYQGRYTLNIPKDKWAFNMDDELEEHCVLCGENYVSGCFRASAKIDETDWSDEIHDTVPESIKTRWNEVISFVMNSTDEEFRANLSQYFFVDSLIDYYLFGLASCGLDAFGKNQIYATYDGQKWIASMYDMDSTWGLWWNGSSFVSATYARNEFQDFKDGGQGNLLYIRLEQLFYTEIQTRWAELRNGVLTIENIINRFERFTDIAPEGLMKEDYAVTTANGEFTGIPSKTANNIQQIRKFARERLDFADDAIAKLNGEPTDPDPDEPTEPDVPDVPDTGEYTVEMNYSGLYDDTGLNPTSTRWKSSDIMPLPTGFDYDTITLVNTTGLNDIISVFDSEQNFVKGYAGKPATCLVQNVQYYAVSADVSCGNTLEVKFTETYPGAIKCNAPNVGLWRAAGLDSSAYTWRSSDKHEIPDGITSGKIKLADGVAAGRIIAIFDADGEFVKDAAQMSEMAFDSTVKYFAVSPNVNHLSAQEKEAIAVYVYIE